MLTVLVATDAAPLADLKQLLEPARRGDPMAPLLWTAKSLRNLAAGLRDPGHRINHNVVAELLRKMGYSLQANRKTPEGTDIIYSCAAPTLSLHCNFSLP